MEFSKNFEENQYATTWVCSPNLASPVEFQNKIWETAPTTGKKLYVVETKLTTSLNFTGVTKNINFRGAKTGYSGTGSENFWFSRNYTAFIDYLKLCSASAVLDSYREFYWRYESPIVLKSSDDAKIQISATEVLDCDWVYLTLKLISCPE